jgi:polyhydroxybutyrate depolymerase
VPRLLVVVLLLAGAVACGSAPVPPAPPTPVAVDRIVTMHRPDGVRKAIVHHPATAPVGAPLVVVLHPAGVPADTMETSFGWDGVADRDGLVVAYPDGLLDGISDTWNAGRCCSPATEVPADDVGFLDALVPALRRFDAVGPRVYAVGFSNGAMLAYAWACARPGTLAGIGAVAGALTADCPAPGPLSVVAVHGAADDEVPAAGGPGPDGTAFPALDATLAPFRTAAACPADPAVVDVSAARVATWSCPGGRTVVRAVVDGLGHAWPGAGPASGTADGPADATGFVWARLRAG